MTHKGPGGHSTRGSHRLSMPAVCPRKWHLRWQRGLVPNVTPIYFTEGTLAHIALAYYRANQMHTRGMKVPAWFYEESMVDCLNRAGAGSPDAVKLGLSIFDAYTKRYGSYDPWEPLAIEEEFTATLGQIRQLIKPDGIVRTDDHEVFSARIDFLLRTNGFIWACDYKTTKAQYKGHLSAFNYEGEFAINWQFLLQTAILRINFGTDFRGVIVERCLKAEPHDFDRTVAPIDAAVYKGLPNTLAKLALMERQLEAEARDAALAGEDMDAWMPAGHFWACYAWGQACEYRQLCRAGSAGQLQETVVREYHRD